MPKPPPLSPADLPDWPEGDPHRPLAYRVLRVWLWSLERDESSARRLLSPDELQRADRFYFAPDRRHFTNARAGLRSLLAASLGCDPREVRFAYDGLGKPRLADAHNSDLRFNLTHSAGVALAVLAKGHEVGVDVEAVRPSQWSSGIAERYFAAQEVAELKRLAAHDQDPAFFRFWTNKEAVVKLLGSGLGFPLQSFVTPLVAEAGASVALPADNPLGLSACWLQALPAGERLKASVCCTTAPDSLELFQTPVW